MMSPALKHYTQDLVLGELWQRPGLAPRDRSLVTCHLKRAMANGLTGPNVFSAMPVFKDVFAQRSRKE